MTYGSELEDDLATCVGCGLCLPHCPTFRVTGEESQSPRGRIALIRTAIDTRRTPPEVRASLDTCVQCRGCEPACPSGVPYGRILESVNQRDEAAGRHPNRRLRPMLWILGNPTLLTAAGRIVVAIGGVPGLWRLLPPGLRLRGVTRVRGRRVRRVESDPDLWLFTGCVMDAWFSDVHRAALALVGAVGARVATPIRAGGCCGALHLHAGTDRRARDIARHTMASMPGDAPIIVDAAGCGAMLKDYGSLLDTDEARGFSDRVIDVHEWIDRNADRLIGLRGLERIGCTAGSAPDPVVVQEPCHLRHVQRVSLADVVERFVPVLRLDDDNVCCGAGGAYSIVNPTMARAIRDRKTAAIRRADPSRRCVVVTANPGCHLHLAADGHVLRSSIEVIASALGLWPEKTGEA